MLHERTFRKGNDSTRWQMGQALEAADCALPPGQTHLQFSFNHFPPDVLSHLEETLLQADLAHVDFFDNKLGTEGAARVAKALHGSHSLSELHLRYNDIGKAGCDAVGALLKANPNLTHVNLSGNKLRADDVHGLLLQAVGSPLQQLCLGANHLGLEAVVMLAEFLGSSRHLTRLDLWSNELTVPALEVLCQAIRKTTTLHRLDLWRNPLGPKGGQVMAALLELSTCKLVKLSLSHTGLGNEGAAALAQGLAANLSLAELDLRDNKIGDAGFVAVGKALEVHPKLAVLWLSSNEPSPEGCETFLLSVLKNETLTSLDLSNTPLPNRVVDRIGAALGIHKKLAHLSLCGCQIDSAGAELLGAAVVTSPALQSLDVLDNQIDEEGVDKIATAVGHNRRMLNVGLAGNHYSALTQKKLEAVLAQRWSKQARRGKKESTPKNPKPRPPSPAAKMHQKAPRS